MQKSATNYIGNGNYISSVIDGNGETTSYGYDEDTGVVQYVATIYRDGVPIKDGRVAKCVK